MYSILYHPRTEKFLRKIPRREAQKIIEKITLLAENPRTVRLDVKKLINTISSYRLRISAIRVIYEVDTKTKKIYIHDIDFRGNIY